jgi:nitroreductase
MALRDLVVKNRSYRRFDQSAPMSMETLEELVDLARHVASGANKQPLKYVLVNDPGVCADVFETLGWAAYLKDWKGPAEGERPAAYVLIAGDRNISDNFYCDHGIAAQTILLGAVEKGFGGCILASINKKKLTAALDLPEHLDILLMLAMGEPAEEVVIEPVEEGDIKYWRSPDDVHHVPKRSLEELVYARFPAK